MPWPSNDETSKGALAMYTASAYQAQFAKASQTVDGRTLHWALMSRRNRVLAGPLRVLVPLKRDLAHPPVSLWPSSSSSAATSSTHRGPRRDRCRADTSAQQAVDVARQILRGHVRHGVVARRDADIDVLSLVGAVHPDVLHRDCGADGLVNGAGGVGVEEAYNARWPSRPGARGRRAVWTSWRIQVVWL